ncbi:MAG TPA: hypothetical protein PKJ21_10105 [Anaerolineae bacterium]|nr:hypothetical protein [Anaerolineae bacterium]
MRRIAFAFSLTADGKLVMTEPRWPARCVCCGEPVGSGGVAVHHVAGQRTDSLGTNRGYPLAWRVPCCPTCISHQIGVPSGVTTVLLVAGLLTLLVVGYLLFLAGLAYNTLAILAYVVLILVMGYGGYVYVRNLALSREALARSRMKPTCTRQELAVVATSETGRIIFTFYNEAYAEEFQQLNPAAVPA